MKKKIITLVVIFELLIISVTFGCQPKKFDYTGVITEKYLLHKNNGGTHNIVFLCDSTKKYISVSVSENQYYNLKVGQHITFNLYEWQAN